MQDRGGDRIILETSRLRLRELTRDDADDLERILGDPEVMRYYPRPKTRDESLAWIDWNLDLYRRCGFGLWAVILKADGKFIGDCGLTLQEVEGREYVEVGYHIDKDRWNSGFATEGATACRDHAFATLAVERLIAIVDHRNIPSRRVAEKLGMGVSREVVRNGRPQLVYEMERPERPSQ